MQLIVCSGFCIILLSCVGTMICHTYILYPKDYKIILIFFKTSSEQTRSRRPAQRNISHRRQPYGRFICDK